MFRNAALIIVLCLTLTMVTASEPIITQSSTISILPETCRILVGQELHLELSGSLPSEAVVTWDVDYGEIVSLLPGSSAVLIAPTTPTVITVYATITNATPGQWTYINRQCIVSLPNILEG
jgi:hypothetical protein